MLKFLDGGLAAYGVSQALSDTAHKAARNRGATIPGWIGGAGAGRGLTPGTRRRAAGLGIRAIGLGIRAGIGGRR